MFDDVRDLYSAVIMERGRRPLHMRRLDRFDATAKGDNPMCGDRVQVWLAYAPDRTAEGRTISDVGFQARGCEISTAAADLMVETVAGRSAEGAKALFADVEKMARSGICPACAALEKMRPLAAVHEYPSRIKCVTLPWHALLAALDGTGDASSE